MTIKVPTNSFTPDNVVMSDLVGKSNPMGVDYTNLLMEDFSHTSRLAQLGKAIDMGGQQIKNFRFQTDGLGAYWVSETEKIRTSKVEWKTAEMRAYKLGLILPISQEALDYTWSDFFTSIRPQMVAAINQKVDEAAFLGIDSPFKFSVKGSAEQNGNVVAGPINYDNMQALEDTLYDINPNYSVNALLSRKSNMSQLANAYQTIGGTNTVIDRPYDRSNGTYQGIPVVDLGLNQMPKNTIIAGDFNQLYYGIPENFRFSITDTAQLSTVQNDDETPVNLWEQDMMAIRVTFTIGIAILRDDAFSILAPAPAADSKPTVGIDMVSEKWRSPLDSSVFYNHSRLNGEETTVTAFGTQGTNGAFTAPTWTVDFGDATDATKVVNPDGSLTITTGKTSGVVTVTATAGGVDSEPVELYVGSAVPTAPAEA
jgi:HK97 family phage major capsid protein